MAGPQKTITKTELHNNAMSAKILLIEDERAIADTVIYALETEGFEVLWHRLGREGVQAVSGGAISLAILDIGLPDGNGLEFCKEIRQSSDVPVIFLTARNEEIDRIVGLEIGADDYVSKPFSPRELAARVKVVLKRVGSPALPAGDSADFVIEREKARIRYRGQWLDLTRYEYLLLSLLLEQPERVFSRAQIMDRIWQEPDTSLERAVDTHVKSLRAKLRTVSDELEPIRTHRGLGYSLSASVRES